MAMKWLGSSLGEKNPSLPRAEAKYSRIQLYIYSSHETFTPSDEGKRQQGWEREKKNAFYQIIYYLICYGDLLRKKWKIMFAIIRYRKENCLYPIANLLTKINVQAL